MKTIHVTLDENNIVKNWYSEEAHGSFKIQDKSTKEEIDSSLFGTEPEKYYYFKSRDKNKVIGEEGGEQDYTYYRTKLIDNPNCRIPEDAIEFPDELFKKLQLGVNFKYENHVFSEYIEPMNINVEKEKYKKRLIQFCKNKLNEVKIYLLGKDKTDADVERYELKYQSAINKKYEDIIVEASFVNIPVEELAKSIIKKHNEWTSTLGTYSGRIEAFRVACNLFIDSTDDLDKIKQLYEEAKKFDASTTDKDIIDLFEKFGYDKIVIQDVNKKGILNKLKIFLLGGK